MIQKLFNWYFTSKALPYWGVLCLDCAIVMFSGYLAEYFELGGSGFAASFWAITHSLLLCVLLFVIAFRVFSTYSGVVRYSSFVDLQRIAAATSLGSLLTYLMSLAVNHVWSIDEVLMPSLSGIILMFTSSTCLMFMVRVAVKSMFDARRKDEQALKTVIYGIKHGAIGMAKMIKSQSPQHYVLDSFISPDGQMVGHMLMGVKVREVKDTLASQLKADGIEAILVSPVQADKFREDDHLINDLIANGIKIMMMPHALEWDGKSELPQDQLHEVDIEDLLPRDKIEVDMNAIGALLTGKRIMITGAAGSIGSEMVRQVAVYHPSELILVDQAETPMHDIRLLMQRQFPAIKSETIVASICNATFMEAIFAAHQPEYVFHAAAYKHVPMMEDNPAMAVQNNIYGTRVIADLAVKYGTQKFVMISTDKAVNPTNVMGCSKRICEIYCQSLNKAIAEGKVKGITQFVTTRFGNVLGSNGSVIPLFKQQIRNGGPLSVTHPDIIRFFMLIPEACKLVLEAGTMGNGGEIFVFDMGKPVKIVDLAKRMIALSGAKNIGIKFTGLREGEKLYEEVLSDQEENIPTKHPKIMRAKVREYEYATACENEKALLDLSYTYNDMDIVKKMKDIVPEYKSQVSKYEILDKK